MVYFFRRGAERMTCETRPSTAGDGYEIEILCAGASRVEHFSTIQQVLSREHQLVAAWRALGWIESGRYGAMTHAASE
jgi:hypothetical protein